MRAFRPIRYSFSNYAGLSTTTATATSQDAAYPATNAKTPHRPFLPYKSGGLGNQDLVFDFASPKTLQIIGIVNANVTQVRFQGNPTNSWGAPGFNQLVTVPRNPLSGRYQVVVILPNAFGTFVYRYLRVLIPTQTPTDGAAAYKIGGVWAGATTLMPKNLGWTMRLRAFEPREDLQPVDQGWRQRHVTGNVLVQIEAQRRSDIAFPTAMVGDQLKTWLDIDRQSREAGFFMLHLGNGDDTHAYVMQHVDHTEWSLDRKRKANSPYTLEEVVGP